MTVTVEQRNKTRISHSKTYLKRYATKEELEQAKDILLRKKAELVGRK